MKRKLKLNKSTIRVLTDLRAVAGGLEKRTNSWPECGVCDPDPLPGIVPVFRHCDIDPPK